MLFTDEPAVLHAGPAPARVTAPAVATGRLVGGWVGAVAGTAGAGLPTLDGAILCLEGTHQPGCEQVLPLLSRYDIRGVAIGDLTGEEPRVVGVLRSWLGALGVPVLEGLPFGHLDAQVCMPLGTPATLDTEAGTLTVSAGTSARPRSR
ncbi:hypothetical protein [Paractinoplanes atraurantiacus]|uniref:Muramoyltetrapeptide carboxypeptidase n=1 Tax=Paractinoplanes atraurantiacus TaxID=1036182 RepID=A0A285KL12_9ACTN|nr:hypothetical protein [Actinoplanes atraurantiacus]SNY72096.1 muramoyltetrapeptide carboxypeptidase [Actinoplanes atraurantiacus]